jgi:hypothetical protein
MKCLITPVKKEKRQTFAALQQQCCDAPRDGCHVKRQKKYGTRFAVMTLKRRLMGLGVGKPAMVLTRGS